MGEDVDGQPGRLALLMGDRQRGLIQDVDVDDVHREQV